MGDNVALQKMHERLNKVANVARLSVFTHLHTLALYVAVKSRQVFALLLQSPPAAPLSPLPSSSSSCSLFYIPCPLNRTSVESRGRDLSHKAEALVQRAALERGGGGGGGVSQKNMILRAVTQCRAELKHGGKRGSARGMEWGGV